MSKLREEIQEDVKRELQPVVERIATLQREIIQRQTQYPASKVSQSDLDIDVKNTIRTSHGNRCCVTKKAYKHFNPADPQEDHVSIAHIIRRKHQFSAAILRDEINQGDHDNIDIDDPKNTILLVWWLHVLYDSCMWCIMPKNIMDSNSPLVVRVLVPLNTSTGIASEALYYYPSRSENLQKLHGTVLDFGRVTPSRRCLARHARDSFEHARLYNWISEVDAELFKQFANTSPKKSVALNDAASISGHGQITAATPRAPGRNRGRGNHRRRIQTISYPMSGTK
jgi:hypothetical protein